MDPNNSDDTIATEAMKRITKIFHLDNKPDDLRKDEQLKQRQLIIEPRLDKFFAWEKDAISKVPAEGATAKGLQYCLN